ncbi:hypothetical protein SEA_NIEBRUSAYLOR_49 [Mycobacterium phage NiebruSaylor]|nr:hypothetical protein SEA_VORRPS_49 [Mycobacterium phage Vorrps]QFP97095.1 hypothetical protein SEA_KRILI_49 [Mycobacterium phage Krili]QOC58482.1 hypothetical protein SEA_SHIDA_50 [Mycobacterium phage Shida]QOC59248.1 hypothetical protein SEA_NIEBRUSAYLOR_49 [Mycobacterium phage NiebruSaylor]QXO13422.1 hypothetical protein SEA_MURAI_50 [Mycobacterium phage Murai]UAW08400.1 hypothetical protein SEA_MORI_49 [Mycobacterium phage Mori]WNO28635.1 hypothetical protein SEA_MADKILLAH_51 [Mycobacte
MTVPTNRNLRSAGTTIQNLNTAGSDKRTTALQSAITVLRNRPQVKADEIVSMAETFHEFLKRP